MRPPQEAVSTGVIRAMRQDDYVCSTYRDHVHALSKGVPAREIMAELFGKKTGAQRFRQQFCPALVDWRSSVPRLPLLCLQLPLYVRLSARIACSLSDQSSEPC